MSGSTWQVGSIAIIVLVVTALHLATPSDNGLYHVAHVFIRKLYFVPILMAAMWFALRGALVVGVGVSGIFLMHAYASPHPYGDVASQAGEVLSYMSIAAAAGLLVTQQEKIRAKGERARRYSERLKIMTAAETLTGALAARDPTTRQHSDRVAALVVEFARFLGFPEDDVRDLRLAGRLHDVGKIGVRDDVLLKPDSLSPEEYAKIAKHPLIGETILAPLGLEKVSLYVAVHHENVDGSGYPAGLKAEEIPLPGRVLAVVDTYDALSSERPYHGARSEKEVYTIMREMAGAKLDEALVNEFWTFRAANE